MKVDEAQIPDALWHEVAKLECPEADCHWSTTLEYSDVESTEQMVRVPEFLIHYQAEHLTRRVGVLAPGTILVFEAPTTVDAELLGGQMEALTDELARAAGHQKFAVLITTPGQGDSVVFAQADRLLELGWVPGE